MLKRFKLWLIIALINGKPFAANIHLISTLAVDVDKSKDGHYVNVNVDRGHLEKIPDAAFFFALNVKYKDA